MMYWFIKNSMTVCLHLDFILVFVFCLLVETCFEQTNSCKIDYNLKMTQHGHPWLTIYPKWA